MLKNRRPGARQTICQSSTDTVHNFSTCTARFFEGLNKIIISIQSYTVAHELMIMKSTHNNNSTVTLYCTKLGWSVALAVNL